jgi:N-acetylglutamate synthase-like GNAT family acetyltransferase
MLFIKNYFMSDVYEVTKDEYLISTDKTKIDVSVVYDYLSNDSYWAENIPLSIVEKSITNSLCFGVYHHNKQIGFARLITDKATSAYLADVFILPGHRGKGLSKWLVQSIHAHPELQTLRRWLLATKDAHTLYEQFGWTRFDENASSKMMQKHNPDIYKANQ